MIQSKESLEWICESIINGKRIPTIYSMNTSKIGTNESAQLSPKAGRRSFGGSPKNRDSPTRLSVVKKEVQ
jgi:hypothetical protein